MLTLTAKRLTLIPTQLPAGEFYRIEQPEPGRFTFSYDPSQAPQVSDADREADLRTLARIEAEIGATR